MSPNTSKYQTAIAAGGTLAILISGFFVASILLDLLQIHIYRHDAFYYISEFNYLDKVSEEGRWLNYLAFPLITHLHGAFLSIFILAAFFVFAFASLYRWSDNFYYSAIIALLFLQIPSLYPLIQWPATFTPAFLTLILAVYFSSRLGVWIFYLLFGILFFATMSNFYYLLPLLHLGYLKTLNKNDGVRFVFLELFPAWATGFIAGYIATQLVTYGLTGDLMRLAEWRMANYPDSLEDVIRNIRRSARFFQTHIADMGSSLLLVGAGVTALFVALFRQNRTWAISSITLFLAIIAAHYVIAAPVGLKISPRTIVATWVGVLALLFFTPNIARWKTYILVPLSVLFSYQLYQRNHENLQWYAVLTNTHYEMLRKAVSMPPETYREIVFAFSRNDLGRANTWIGRKNGVTRGFYMEPLDRPHRLAPAAFEAGFTKITFRSALDCSWIGKRVGGNFEYRSSSDCSWVAQKNRREFGQLEEPERENMGNIYQVLSDSEGRIVLSLRHELE